MMYLIHLYASLKLKRGITEKAIRRGLFTNPVTVRIEQEFHRDSLGATIVASKVEPENIQVFAWSECPT